MTKNDIQTAYLVNLPSQTRRRVVSERMYRDLGLTVRMKIYPAFDVRGTGWSHVPTKDSTTNLGAMGCTLSHWGIYKSMIVQGERIALVLEDDFLPKPNLDWSVLESAPDDWDILVIGWGVWAETLDKHVILRKVCKNWCVSSNGAGTYCYIVRHPEKLNLAMQSVSHVTQVDNVLYNLLMRRGDINVYHLVAPMVGHRSDCKSIANG